MSSEKPTSKDKADIQAFDKFKGLVLIVIGLTLLFYLFNSALGVRLCNCPLNYRYQPSLADIFIPTSFLLFLAALGITLIISGFTLRKRGAISWKRFSPQNITVGFAVCFACMVTADFIVYLMFS